MAQDLERLAGKRVLITGAARGIGAALARRLHGRGAHVAVAGLEAGVLAEVAASVDGPCWPCDVTDRAGHYEMLATTINALRIETDARRA